MKSPLISILIPAYNAEKYISETITSVLNQTYSKFELIVVDDGSTDNTAKITENFCDNDTRVKLVKQNNAGVSVARNTAFSISKGEYISYLDADDIWEPFNLELWLKKFSEDLELGIVHSDCGSIDENSNKLDYFYNGKEGYIIDELLLGGQLINGTSGSLIKREIIEHEGGYDSELSTCADQEFFFRIAKKNKVGRVSVVTWYYRFHSNNMHSNLELNERDTILAHKKAKKNKLYKSEIFRMQCYSNMYYMLAGLFLSSPKKIKFVKYLLLSILYYPPVLKKIILKSNNK